MSSQALPRDRAIEEAASLLGAARLPLVYGLSESTVEAQRHACYIAELSRGVVDVVGRGTAGQYALEQVGVVTASLGEISRRADLVLFWGFDPDAQTPGFVARYIPARADRTLLSLGASRGPSLVSEHIALDPGRDLEALLALRALLLGRRVEGWTSESCPLERLRGLVRRLAAARYGVVVTPPLGPEESWAIASLVRDANRKTRLRLFTVRPSGNALGAENVLTWQTGFPGAISFSRGFPRYGPVEFGGEALLARNEVDACLLVGCDPVRHLSDETRKALRAIATIHVGPAPSDLGLFIEAAPLENTPGAVYRMDGILTRRKLEPPSAPTEAFILEGIAAALESERRREHP